MRRMGKTEIELTENVLDEHEVGKRWNISTAHREKFPTRKQNRFMLGVAYTQIVRYNISAWFSCIGLCVVYRACVRHNHSIHIALLLYKIQNTHPENGKQRQTIRDRPPPNPTPIHHPPIILTIVYRQINSAGDE